MRIAGGFVIFFGLVLVCVEIGLREIDPQPSFRWFQYDDELVRWNRGRDDRYFQIDPRVNGFLTFNSRLERARTQATIEKPVGVTRIVVLGSSLTMGWPDNHGVTEMLKESLDKSGRDAEVVNCSLGNSNMATLYATYLAHCSRYRDPDFVVLALPVNTLIDYFAANSFLWGENTVDDPNIAFFLLKEFSRAELKMASHSFGTPRFDLNPEQRNALLSYFNDTRWFYDHSEVVRWLVNRYTYAFFADREFLEKTRSFLKDASADVPSTAVSIKIIEAFKTTLTSKNFLHTQIVVMLTPTLQGLLLRAPLRNQILDRIKSFPQYQVSIDGPDSFIQRKYQGDLGRYLEVVNRRNSEFKEECRARNVKVIDGADEIDASDLSSYYLSDLYHFSQKGHAAMATALRKTILDENRP